MTPRSLPEAATPLFSHVTADKAATYRAIMDVFAAAKRQFRLHLRPDEVRAEAGWPDQAPTEEAVQAALDQLTEWGNLQAQVDTSRVATLEDFYRRRLLYRMTPGGEAAEAGLRVFVEALGRRGELQSVALDDILARLAALERLGREAPLDSAKIHAELRDLVHVFEGLAGNAEAFIASLARTIELQRAEADAVMGFKARLIDYLQRFIGDLVTRSAQIADVLTSLAPHASLLLRTAAEREARDAAPGGEGPDGDAVAIRVAAWSERWGGLERWFVGGRGSSQAELLRRSALGAIPRLLQAVSLLNERRSGRSDRAADFRRLALWFAEAGSEADAHRLWRAAFALSPARHLALAATEEAGAGTSWRDAPPVALHPMLRERGVLPTRGGPPKIRDRSQERAQLAARVAREAEQTERARRRLATGKETRLSELGPLDRHAFGLFLNLLGEALATQTNPDEAVERRTMDGSLSIRLEPLAPSTRAEIETELGCFSGRDHRLTIRAVAMQ
jgi:uncharacterized protein (TIGR02677 family)